MKRTIKLVDNLKRLPIIKIRIPSLEGQNKITYAIIDSASETCFINKESNNYDLYPIYKETTCELVGLNLSSKSKKMSFAQQKFFIDGYKKPLFTSCCVIEFNELLQKAFDSEGVQNKIIMILGSDFLEAHNAKLDFKKKTLTLHLKL